MENRTKWYNEPQMVGSLLIFFPPMGLYGLHKSEAIAPKWKKIAYATLLLVCMLFVAVYLG